MSDKRNFRSSYYEKVGCRGVEEKKSLEILLKESPWDKVKLQQFCLRFTVPTAYRNLIWRVLLGILPVFPDSHKFVLEQRTAQYEDLHHALEVLDIADESTPKAEAMFAMWQLELGTFEPMLFPETEYPASETFIPIAETLLEMYSDVVDVYWLSKGFSDIIRNTQKEMDKLQDAFTTMLEKEDLELYNHLTDIKALEVLPLIRWYNTCFSGVLSETSLTKIWDKLCGGAPKILSFVAVMLLVTLRRSVMKAETADDVLKCVSEIPEQCEEVVANKAIELWQCYGAQPQSDQIAKK